MIRMNSTLKTILKAAAIAVVPGLGAFWLLSRLAKEHERQEFREYIRKTYGKGSKYENENVEP
jgi:hypothetical protein